MLSIPGTWPFQLRSSMSESTCGTRICTTGWSDRLVIVSSEKGAPFAEW